VAMFHIADWWLHAVPENDDLAFTDDEYDHLIICENCFLSWWNCVVEVIARKSADAEVVSLAASDTTIPECCIEEALGSI
jgi:hypothetical protein